MSIIRSGVPREHSLVSISTFKLNDPSSTAESIQSGEEFAHTISYISKGEFEPERASYPRFKKTFWEESRYNPAIANTQQEGHEHDAHQKEQAGHWNKKGSVMSMQVRFPEKKPPCETGPIKAASYPHLFEKGEQYFGRKREVNPFATAKAYAKPLDRVNQATLRMIEEDKAKAGPGTYKPPDYWEKIVYGSVAEPLRPSAMMEIKEKRDIFMYYDIPDYTELKKKAKMHAIVEPFHSQRGKISSLLPTTRPPTASDVNMNLSSSPRRKLNQAVSKSRMRGAKFPDSKLDFNYRGVPHDTHFVRLRRGDEVMIAPMLISSDKPEDEMALAGTQRLPLWGDVGEKRDIYCVPANSNIEMFSGDGTSPPAQQDVYTLPGEVSELTVGKITLPGRKKHGSGPVTITSRKPALNTTRPQTTPAPSCTPYISTRAMTYQDLRRQKKFSSHNSPQVLAPGTLPLHMSDRFSVSRRGPLSPSHCGEDDADFNHLIQQSEDIVHMFGDDDR